MQRNEIPKLKKDEAGFLAALVIIVLLILPSVPLGKYGGAMAMMAGSIIGLIAYFVLFGERVRSRGQLKLLALAIAVGAVLAAAITIWQYAH